MVKNRRAKHAVRRYKAAHPGMSYTQAQRELREQREKREQARTSLAGPHTDEIPHETEQGVSSHHEHRRVGSGESVSPQNDDILSSNKQVSRAHYLTDPFGLKSDTAVKQSHRSLPGEGSDAVSG